MEMIHRTETKVREIAEKQPKDIPERAEDLQS